ncbi:MAG: lactonase family protein [Verrucomicrobiales bacterium]|nr:lactonase family protein [Verrucomicrobiales bacterium]
MTRFILILIAAIGSITSASAQTIWIGTGGKGAEGIYKTTLNSENGKLSDPVLAAEIAGPGFLALNKDKTLLYAACGVDKGSVAAFRINDDESLELLNTVPTGDGGAAHLSLDNEGKILFSAQYGGGSVAAYAIKDDGSIGAQTALIKHTGSGPDESRQKSPHPHWSGVSPDNRFLFIPDLGADKVFIYKIDHAAKTITAHGAGIAVPGGGPRHMKFGKDGTKIYLLNEMLLSVTVFDYDVEAGTMTALQTIETLPEELKEIPNKAAEIRVHPSGKFVYASNRGHDSITAFAVDSESGELSFIEREAIRGSWPRNFNLSPDGKWLIAAGRYSNTLSVFSVDQESGGLLFSGNIANVPAPICLEF